MPDHTIIWAGDLHVFEMMPQQAVESPLSALPLAGLLTNYNSSQILYGANHLVGFLHPGVPGRSMKMR